MTNALVHRTRWTFDVGQRKIVLAQKADEQSHHVLMKAFLWALYLPKYPALSMELPIGSRYRPDVVQVDPRCRPQFWAESGKLGKTKICSLVKRFPHTHFAFGKWQSNLLPLERMLRSIVSTLERTEPIDLISFPADSAKLFLNNLGQIVIGFTGVTHIRIEESC